MKKAEINILIIFIILIAFSNSIRAQESDYLLPENRKGQLFIKVASEYRITPLPVESPISQSTYVNTDTQNSGTAFSYALDMFITKNLNIGFSHSFRYDDVNSFSSTIDSDFGIEPTQKSLIQGYHFYIDYHFKIFRESEVYVRLGRSLINRGTDITIKETFFDQEDNPVVTSVGGIDYAYEPYNFGIGWKKRKVELLIGCYTSNISEYFEESANFTIPYIKFSYNLGRL